MPLNHPETSHHLDLWKTDQSCQYLSLLFSWFMIPVEKKAIIQFQKVQQAFWSAYFTRRSVHTQRGINRDHQDGLKCCRMILYQHLFIINKPHLSVQPQFLYYILFCYIKPLLEKFSVCILLCLPDHIKSKINICVCTIHVQHI